MERKSQYKHRAKNVAKIRQRHKEEELGKTRKDRNNILNLSVMVVNKLLHMCAYHNHHVIEQRRISHL